MRSLGAAERALESMVLRSMNRNAFGRPLGRFDSSFYFIFFSIYFFFKIFFFNKIVQKDISQSRIEIESARLLVLKTAHLIDTKGSKGARDYISMIKIIAIDTTCKVIDKAIQVKKKI